MGSQYDVPPAASVLGVQGLGDDQAKLLDLMDKIQFAKISTDKLPQIAVVGDQSSGKSSVLTSLTGIPFTRSNMACTRFATEIRLRRSARSSTTVWIMPDDSSPKQERKALEAFRREVPSDTPEALTALMREASDLISPNGRGSDTQRARFAAKDKLIIEKSGPDQPLLTLVDLPGLVKVPSSEQTAEDLQMIDAVSDMYMKDPMTIILAVVSGNIDWVQGIILHKVLDFDPRGHRTIGVLTKPDLTDVQGYTNKYLGLVTRQDDNTNYHFKLGWYVLRNPGHSSSPTLEERKREEADFFRSGTWSAIPPGMRGADALRSQLSVQLQRAIARRIPSLQRQIQDADAECSAQLDELGVGLDGPKECTVELGRLFALSDSLVLPAVDGTYRNPPKQAFFRDEHDPRGTPAQNLRARVLQESDAFAAQFRQLGRRLTFISDDGTVDVNAKKEFARAVAEPLLPQIRGRELPGDPNTRAPYILFMKHSREWPVLAQRYQDAVTAICRAFLAELLAYAWPARMRLPLREGFLKAKLADMSRLAGTELENLNGDKFEIQPFDPDYEECMRQVILDAAGRDAVLTDAERVVEQMIAYYKLVERIFIRNVIYQVVERHLITGIRQMFASVGVHYMTDETVMAIAADDSVTRDARNALKLRKEKIQEAREICAEIQTRRDLQLQEDDFADGDDNPRNAVSGGQNGTAPANTVSPHVRANETAPVTGLRSSESSRTSLHERLALEQLQARLDARRLEEERRRAEEAEMEERRQEDERQRELRKQEELARQAELKRQEELARQEEAMKQEELARQEELKKQELARREELRRQEELKRQEELARLAELRRREDLAKQEELIQKELTRQVELRRQKELAMQEELRRQEKLQLEEQLKKQEAARNQEELARQELWRQEEMRKREELRKQDQQAREEQRLQEERRRRDADWQRQNLQRQREEHRASPGHSSQQYDGDAMLQTGAYAMDGPAQNLQLGNDHGMPGSFPATASNSHPGGTSHRGSGSQGDRRKEGSMRKLTRNMFG